MAEMENRLHDDGRGGFRGFVDELFRSFLEGLRTTDKGALEICRVVISLSCGVGVGASIGCEVPSTQWKYI